MTVHYNNALRPEEFVIPICAPKGGGLAATTDKALVTCKRCLRLIGEGKR